MPTPTSITQCLLGLGLAAALLPACGYTPEACARICYLIGRHHTYTDIYGADYQILVEADFLVNLFEDNLSKEAYIMFPSDLYAFLVLGVTLFLSLMLMIRFYKKWTR